MESGSPDGRANINKSSIPIKGIEGLLINIGGLLTLISSVPNIIVGKTAGIEFVDFFIKAAPYVVVATFVTTEVICSGGSDSEKETRQCH